MFQWLPDDLQNFLVQVSSPFGKFYEVGMFVMKLQETNSSGFMCAGLMTSSLKTSSLKASGFIN